jgi:hypothetical protein
MAVKTFTSEILTSSDTNTYLANSGLVYVTSATIGSAVSSVTISSAFNSTYDAYKIVIAGGVSSADISLGLKLGASATGYYASRTGAIYSTAASFLGADNNAAQWAVTGTGLSANGLFGAIDLQNPFLAKYTYMQASYAAATVAGSSIGLHQVATSYSAFTITPTSGTLTGGTITVYGYRLG